jgi:hypothetical protein
MPLAEPIAPCIDLFTLGVPLPLFFEDCCGDFLPTTEDPEGCEFIDSDTIVEDPCIVLSGGDCVNNPQSFEIFLVRTVECCETPQICGQIVIGDFAIARYESEWFDCDDVPASIELTLDDFYDDTDVTLNWSCEELCELDDLTVTLPTSLTLTVS